MDAKPAVEEEEVKASGGANPLADMERARQILGGVWSGAGTYASAAVGSIGKIPGAISGAAESAGLNDKVKATGKFAVDGAAVAGKYALDGAGKGYEYAKTGVGKGFVYAKDGVVAASKNQTVSQVTGVAKAVGASVFKAVGSVLAADKKKAEEEKKQE